MTPITLFSLLQGINRTSIHLQTLTLSLQRRVHFTIGIFLLLSWLQFTNL